MTPAALRKAAIFLASVDDDTAHAVLEQLPPAQAAALRAEWAMLDDVDAEQQEAVIHDFLDAGRPAPPAIPDLGLALDDTLQHHLRLETPAECWQPAEIEEELRAPFDFLQETDAALVAQHLDGEHPQAIALVLSHLPLTRAAAVLEHLPNALQEEALARLVEADETHPEVVREVERSLELRLGEQARRRDVRRRGENLASALLGEMRSGSGQRLLSRLAERDASLASRLGFERRTPRSLDDLDRDELHDALRAVGGDVAALALAGATAEEAERTLARLPVSLATALRDRLLRLGPTRLDDLEAAYACVLAAVGQ